MITHHFTPIKSILLSFIHSHSFPQNQSTLHPLPKRVPFFADLCFAVLLYHLWICLAEIVYRRLESAFSLPWTCSWWLSFRRILLSVGWLGHGGSHGLLLYADRLLPKERLSRSRRRLPTTRTLAVVWAWWPSYAWMQLIITSSSPCSLSAEDTSLAAIWFSL